jgi:hypothetical protein
VAEYPEPLFQQISHPGKKTFLAAFAHCGRIRRAAQAAQVSWRLHYYWLEDDPDYAAAFEAAKKMAGDFLEDEAIRRAMEGWEKPVYYKGEHVDNERVYSDLLLIVMLKAAKPEKYRENVKVEAELTVGIADRTREANARIMRLRRGSSDADTQAS